MHTTLKRFLIDFTASEFNLMKQKVVFDIVRACI